MMRMDFWDDGLTPRTESATRCKSLERRRLRWCASSLKGLSSDHAWRPLLPTLLCVSAVVIYSLADKLRDFVAGVFIPQYHYPYAVALCFTQVLVSLLCLNLLHVLDLMTLKHYSKCLGERLLVPAICDSAQAVMAMWARANSSNTGLFAVTTRLLALLTIGWSHGLKLAVPPSSHITVIIAILSGISVIITASQGLPDMDLMEYIYAPLCLIFHSLALTWIAKVSEVEHCHSPEARVSVFNVYYTHLVNQSLVLGPLCLLHPDGPRQVLSHSSWHSLLFDGYLLAILLLGMMLNLLTGLTALQFSPFAAALLHSARELTQPFLKLL